MSLWTIAHPTKTLRRVGYGRWIDPTHVAAVEPTTAGNIRIHLVGGTTLDVPVPSTEGIDASVEKLLRALSDPTRRSED